MACAASCAARARWANKRRRYRHGIQKHHDLSLIHIYVLDLAAAAQEILDLHGVEVFAAGDDDILFAVDQDVYKRQAALPYGREDALVRQSDLGQQGRFAAGREAGMDPADHHGGKMHDRLAARALDVYKRQGL